MIVTNSVADPHLITDQYGYALIDDRTPVSPRLVPGEATAVFIVAGQSQAANYANAPYTPTSSRVHNLNAYTGGLYLAKDPMLGCDNGLGSFMGRLGDKLIAAGKYARVIFVSVAVGNTPISRWRVGGDLNPHLVVAVRRCAALGLPVTALLWHQGESDAGALTTQDTYESSLLTAIQSTRDAGLTAPWFVAQTSYTASDTPASRIPIRAAQAAIVNPAAGILAGPDTDTIDASHRYDGTHFDGTGADMHAELWKGVIISAL